MIQNKNTDKLKPRALHLNLKIQNFMEKPGTGCWTKAKRNPVASKINHLAAIATSVSYSLHDQTYGQQEQKVITKDDVLIFKQILSMCTIRNIL